MQTNFNEEMIVIFQDDEAKHELSIADAKHFVENDLSIKLGYIRLETAKSYKSYKKTLKNS